MGYKQERNKAAAMDFYTTMVITRIRRPQWINTVQAITVSIIRT